MTTLCLTKNRLLLNNLMKFYEDKENLLKMTKIINGESNISLRIVDWFVTNFAKKYYTVYNLTNDIRFKVYNDYKLQLKSYSKKNFDPFCRWDRIKIPYDETNFMETTIGQLNFFKWAIENQIIEYIQKKENFDAIEQDMNSRNSTSKRKKYSSEMDTGTRKKREELSISASKCIKKEDIKIIVKFN
jgi:sulfur relay (sulfurtransferase) DsrC/TusE family protein